jgi:hypothetical protein
MDTIDPGVTGRASADSDLIPSRRVLQRYSICDKTLDRWTANPALNFPQPVLIFRRRYWRVAELAAWEKARAKGGVA